MAVFHLSVSQLKCACLDAGWLEQWLAGKNPPIQSWSPPGTPPVYGRKFHELADRFTGWLREAGAAPGTDGPALWEALYEKSAGPVLLEMLKSGLFTEAHALKQRLRSFCDRLAQLHAERSSFKTWADIFVAQEYSVKDIAYHLGDDTVFVSGRLDALRLAPGGEWIIVDYKLTAGAQLKHDLIQIAIYASLLRKEKPGLHFHGLLEFYHPELHLLEVQPAELNAIFEEQVMPVLYRIVQAGAGSPGVAKSLPADGDPSGLAEAIRRCFASFNLGVEVFEKQEAPQLIRYKVRPAVGVKVISLENRAADLQVALALPQAPLIEPSRGFVTIDVPREKPGTVPWRDVQALPEVKNHASPVSFAIGIGVSNHVLLADFQDSNMAHALVAGASGSGKSEFLKSLTAFLLARNDPEVLRLTVVDPKILTFGPLAGCRHLTQPVITELPAAIACLESAVEEMDRRYRELARERFENLSQRHRSGARGMPWQILIFDEFADLILVSRSEKARFETLVSRLTAKGRAAGFHLVLATQRPDRNVVTGLIKANLPLKICLRVTSAINSQLVIDQSGGESLVGRGDLLCDRGQGVERAQSPYIPSRELAALAR